MFPIMKHPEAGRLAMIKDVMVGWMERLRKLPIDPTVLKLPV
jgi:hypothetical protein